MSRKSHIDVLAAPDAAATHGFRMVLLSHASKQLCQRYMRSTECPSNLHMLIVGLGFSVGLILYQQ